MKRQPPRGDGRRHPVTRLRRLPGRLQPPRPASRPTPSPDATPRPTGPRAFRPTPSPDLTPRPTGPRTSPPERHPLNAPGPFYTEKGFCLACGVPETEAPDLIVFHDGDETCDIRGCYFKKQPETPEELDRAIEALSLSCCASHHYGGTDPAIIRRLRERRVDASQIDNL